MEAKIRSQKDMLTEMEENIKSHTAEIKKVHTESINVWVWFSDMWVWFVVARYVR